MLLYTKVAPPKAPKRRSRAGMFLSQTIQFSPGQPHVDSLRHPIRIPIAPSSFKLKPASHHISHLHSLDLEQPVLKRLHFSRVHDLS